MKDLLLRCWHSPEKLLIHHTFSSRISHGELDALVDERWQSILTKAHAEGKKAWNSVTYRFEGIELEGDALIIRMSEIEFKDMAVWREYERPNSSSSRYPDTLFVATFLHTLDDCYLFGEVAGKTLIDQHTRILIGGVLSKAEGEVHSSKDLLQALYRELHEEINVQHEEVTAVNLCGIIRTPYAHVGLLFHSQVSLSSEEILGRYHETNDGELHEPIVVPSNEVQDFLLCQKSGYLPLIASLDLTGITNEDPVRTSHSRADYL